MRGVDLDLLAQPADQIVDRAVEDIGLAPADEVEQPVAAHHLPRMPHQRVEQMIFARRQRDLIALAIDQYAFDLAQRSEEHTSELQSLMRISYADFCLKKK